MEKQNPHCVKPIVKTPLVKVLEILKNFLKEVFKQGLGQSPKVFPYHFYPVAEMRQGNKLPPPHKSRWTGFGSEQPEIAARKTAASEICTT